MRYYPLSRVVTGSKTTGMEFTLKGEPYVGPYYKTFDGKYYTGNDPVTGDSKQLDPPVGSSRDTTIGSSRDTNQRTYLKAFGATGLSSTDLGSFVTITYYYPKPTPADYDRGFFFRYFAKKRNETTNLIEVHKDVHESLKLVDSIYNYELYHSIQLYWQLTGPLVDTVNPTNGIRTAGIEDTNKRLVEMKDESFKGLRTHIGDKYNKFAKPVA